MELPYDGKGTFLIILMPILMAGLVFHLEKLFPNIFLFWHEASQGDY